VSEPSAWERQGPPAAAAGGGATDPGLRRLALRTLLGAFPGHTPPPDALRLVADGLAGAVLFGYNIDTTAQVAALTDALRSTRPDVLVSIDEEGGDVTRLAHATGSPYPGNAALGRVDDEGLTRRIYRAIGADLAALGIGLDLAPTVDVNSADDNPVIGTRSFGADPTLVARHAVAAVTGLQEAGVAACAKHFPGHGATVDDSHLALPTVDVPMHVLRDRDLPPFAAVVTAGAKAVMTAHIRVPALTGDLPATLSRPALVDLLRVDLGFTGALVTDALEMRGAARIAGGIGPAAVQALAAGADLLCIGAAVDAALVEHVAATIAAAITDGRLARDRVEQAAQRTDELARWAAGAPPTSHEAGRNGTRPTLAEREHRDLGYAVARQAVHVEGSLAGFEAPLVVQLEAAITFAEGPVPWGLAPHVNGAEYLRVTAGEVAPETLLAAARGRPIVVIGRHTHRNPAACALVERLAASNPVALVEMGWPSTWRPAGVRAFVTTYGASHANGRAAAVALGLAA
jgi:beta-N-acetylhexosaminidase